MPFTPITILAGTIDSSDVQDNLDRMKKYVDGTVVVGDLNATAGWCESKHVMVCIWSTIWSYVNVH